MQAAAGHPVRASARPRVAPILFQLSLVILLFAYYGYFVEVPGPNELSRYDLAFALVHDHTTRIDAYEMNTIDKARHAGSYYTDKAIGLSLLGAPVVWALERFLGLGEYGAYRADYPVHVATRFTVALPAALAAWALYRMLRRLKVPPPDALLVTAALALGSAYYTFATQFVGHTTTAALGIIAAGAVFARQASSRRWLAAGLLAGLAVLVEFPSALTAGAIGCLALWRSWEKVAAARSDRKAAWHTPRFLAGLPVVVYGLGGLVALLPLPVYNLVSFGSPWSIGYGFVEDPAFAGARQGLFGITQPSASALSEILFSPAGLLTQSPYLALALVGFALWLRRGKGRRAEGLVCLGVVAAYLYVNASYYLPMGGSNQGPRFLVAALPFLALGLAFVPRWARWLASPLVGLSALRTLSIVAAYPKSALDAPGSLGPYWWPNLLPGDVVANGGTLRLGLHDWESLLPLGALAGLAVLLLVAGAICVTLGAGPRALTWGAALGCAVAVGASLYVTAPLDLSSPLRPPSAYAERAFQDPPEPLHLTYGDELELVGYRLQTETVEPGDAVRVDLYWRVLRTPRAWYVVFVHVFGREGQKVGGFDAVPGIGSYPFHMWKIGEVVRETYSVKVSADAVAPSALTIRVGAYESGSLRRLQAADERGESLGDVPAVTLLRLAPPLDAAQPPSEPRARLGDTLALLDWSLGNPTLRAGDSLVGKLRWLAQRPPSKDYTVFVQVLGPSGLVAQHDSQPLGGDYSTTLWRVGEEVDDGFAVPLPPDLKPGRYTVIAGMYDLQTMQRLPTERGDFVRLGEVDVH